MDRIIKVYDSTRALCLPDSQSLKWVGLFPVAMLLLSVVPAMAQPISIGEPLPMVGATMSDIQGQAAPVGDLAGESGLVVVFWAKSCPWIDRYEERFVSIVREYGPRGFGFVAINSNDPIAYPEDAKGELLKQSKAGGYSFPYLIDVGGVFANVLGARRTPEVFVFDSERKLVYSGAIDDSPAIADAVGNPHLRNVLDALVVGSPVNVTTTNAIGCTIKFAPH